MRESILTGKDEALLVGSDTLLTLNLRLEVVNGIGPSRCEEIML